MQGSILAGRYRLVHQLGKGGMGAVWAAEHLTLHSHVAVKLLDTQIAKNPDAVERFQREAQAAAALRSAHVVQVLDYGVEGDTPFLVMELLRGEDLGARLSRLGRLTPEALVGIMQQVARAVGRAHDTGIVHRDLKPENIFLVIEDNQEIVKVLDFGIAKSAAPGFKPSATRTGVTMGTPYYMSPEQAEGKREVDHRTDLWALGVICSECLTGVRPFDGETFGELLLNICARPAPIPSTLAPVPPHFDAWFAKATERDPARRFASVHELCHTLGELVAGRVPAALQGIPMRTAPLDGPPAPGGTELRGALSSGESATRANAAVTLPEEPATIPVTGRWILPTAGFAAVALLAASAWWMVSRPAAAERPEAEPSARAAAATAPSPPNSEPSSAPGTSSAQPARPIPAPPITAAAAALEAKPSANTPRAPAKPAPLMDQVKPAPDPKTQKPASATLRCKSDPFTGALRPTSSGAPGSVACKRNPFTGNYQRL